MDGNWNLGLQLVFEHEAERVADRMGGEGDVGFGARGGRRRVVVFGF